MDIDKLEGKIDRVAAGATEIHMGFGGVKFQTMMELMEFSKLMAVSGSAVPFHLRGNPGACLAICTKALRFGFDPFALAEHSFSMSKEVDTTITSPQGGRSTVKEKIETIAYDSYVIRAVIEAHAPVEGRLKYTYAGDGDEMTCTVTAVPLGEKEPISFTSPTLGQRKKDIGTSDNGYPKGSPLWNTKPRVQLGYDTGRDFCRLHFPEVLMGWYDKDEFEEYAKAAIAKDVTPASGLKDRLAAGAKDGARGFSAEHVTDQIGHSPGVTLETGTAPKEAVPVVAASDAKPTPAKRKTAATDAPKPSDAAPENEQAPAEIDSKTPAPKADAPKDRPALSKDKPAPNAKPGPETPLARGLRLLKRVDTKDDIKDLQDSIASELSGADLAEWKQGCEDRMKAVAA